VFRAGQPGRQPDSSGPDGDDNSARQARQARQAGEAGEAGEADEAGEPAEETRQTGSPRRSDGTAANKIIGIAVVAAAVVAAGTAYAVTQTGGHQGAPSSDTLAVSGPPMHVLAMSPASATRRVNGASPITVRFSDPVAANSPRPRLSPSVPGKWIARGYLMVFTPSVSFGQYTRVTITVPGGKAGVRSAAGALLTASVSGHFRTARYSQLALSELLAEQGYLPMSFTPASNGVTKGQNAIPSPDAASLTPAGEAYSPPAGSFSFDQGYPLSLQSQWTPDRANVLLRGAVMAFESEHKMTVDANLSAKFWNALFLAQERGQRNQNGYTYAVADQHDPETLTIYHNGHVVLRSPTNTGIPVAPTVNGTFPVYARYRFQIMSGTNPGGSHYADPVSFVSYFNGGDAVHYFPRGGYGYQQSLGCVELPYTEAEQAYPFLTYGSLVNVTG
jgi:lipoprotein-anchoring transpeptidase ErfK/SrfK